MSTAGSGDVLTGMLLSLLAQGYQPSDAALAGVYQITVIFVGSSGERGITRADVTVIRQDGSKSSQSILPLKGIAEVNLNGSEKPDRVQIDATVAGGETYHVYDRLLSAGDGI